MMDQTGNIIFATIQRPGTAGNAVLQLNQPVMAKIIRVSGDSVWLSIQGMRIEAKLTAAEQAEALKNANYAQFLVKGLTSQSLHLQLLRTDQTSLPPSGNTIPLNMDGLAKALLQASHLPSDEVNLTLAKAMLARGMNLSAEEIAGLRQALDKMGRWNEQDIQNLLNLKESGFPYSIEILRLMAKGKMELSSHLIGLRAQLESLLNQRPQLDPKLAGLVRDILSQMDAFFLRWSDSSKSMQEALVKLFELIGNSVERQLASMLLEGKTEMLPGGLQNFLLNLRSLQESLRQSGFDQLSRLVDDFISQFKVVQFFNSAQHVHQGEEGWLQLDFPMVYQPAQNVPAGQSQTAIRIAYRKGKPGSEDGTDFTRLILQVDLKNGESVEVDVSIASKKMGVGVNSTSQEVRLIAEEEFPLMQAALSRIGYEIAAARFSVIQSFGKKNVHGHDLTRAVSVNERYDIEA